MQSRRWRAGCRKQRGRGERDGPPWSRKTREWTRARREVISITAKTGEETAYKRIRHLWRYGRYIMDRPPVNQAIQDWRDWNYGPR